MATHRPQSAPNTTLQSSDVPCCSCAVKQKSSFCTLHQSWLQLQDALVDKDRDVNTLRDEISRLSVCENESQRKDSVISNLRNELAQLQKNITDKNMKMVTLQDEIKSSRQLLYNKEAETHKLQTKLSDVTNKLTLSTRQTAALQAQLAQKTELLASHCEELREIKKEKRFTADNLSSAQEQTREKQGKIMSLQDRVKRLRSLNQDLQSKLETCQTSYSQVTENEKQLKDELNRLKTQTNQVKLQLTSTYQQLSDTKSSNIELANELGSTREELERLCHQLSALVGLQSTTSQPPIETSSIVTVVSNLVTEQLLVKQNCQQTQLQLQEVTDTLTSLQCDIETLTNCISTQQTESILSSLNDIEVDISLQPIVKYLIQCLNEVKENHRHLDIIRTTVCQLLESWKREDKENEKETEEDLVDPVIKVQLLSEKAQTYHSHCKQLQEKLAALTEQQTNVLQQTLSSLKEDYDQRLSVAVETARQEERQEREREKQDVITRLEKEKKVIKDENIVNMELIQAQLQQMQTLLEKKTEEFSKLESSCSQLEHQKSSLQTHLDEMSAALKSQENNYQETIVITAHKYELKEQELLQTIVEYKVQCQEHSKTIVSLEEKLLALLNENENWKQKEKDGNLRITHLQEELDAVQKEGQSSQEKNESFITTIRRQLTLANTSAERDRQKVAEMSNTLRTAQQSFQDNLEQLKWTHSQEITDLRHQLAQRESTLSTLQHDILNRHINQTQTPPQSIQLNEEQTTPPDDIKKECDLPEDSLVAMGHRCLGENHQQIIQSQCHALRDMRWKINDLMTAKPPIPSHQAALKELAKLRQELTQQKTEDIIRSEQDKRKDEVVVPDICPISSGRSQHVLELQDTLQDSETAYYQLLEALCDKLSIPHPPEYKPLTDANKVARQHILKERNEFINGTLKESLVALRRRHPKTETQTTGIGTSPSKIENEDTDIAIVPLTVNPDLTQYGVYSNDILERLDQEKRLQQAITKRKEFKSIKQGDKNRRQSHSCLLTTDELKQKVDDVRRVYSQKLDKKSAEISRLKTELQSSHLHNSAMTSKIKLVPTKLSS